MHIRQSDGDVAGLGDISHPWEGLVLKLGLNDFQIPDLNSARREIRNLELNLYRSLPLPSTNTTHATTKSAHHTATLVIVASHRGKTKFGAHEELFTAAELLDFPYYGGGFRGVVDGADICTETGGVRVVGDRNDDADIIGGTTAFELGFCLCKLGG